MGSAEVSAAVAVATTGTDCKGTGHRVKVWAAKATTGMGCRAKASAVVVKAASIGCRGMASATAAGEAANSDRDCRVTILEAIGRKVRVVATVASAAMVNKVNCLRGMVKVAIAEA